MKLNPTKGFSFVNVIQLHSCNPGNNGSFSENSVNA